MTFEPVVEYVEADIPPGMTCTEYRRQLYRAPPRKFLQPLRRRRVRSRKARGE